MRNVFDQYDQPENRLTHALATALNSDPKLVRPFLRNVVGVRGPIPSKLEIVEQSLPGDSPSEEGGKRAKGLPDACIHDGESWAVIIESKVSSPLTRGQLDRHLSTMARRGFPDCQLLTITVGEPKASSLPKMNYVTGNHDVTREMLLHPRSLPGLGDGGAHLGLICDVSFPTYLLSHWGRERTRGEGMPIEWLVKRQSRDTAVWVGLEDRGLLATGIEGGRQCDRFRCLGPARTRNCSRPTDWCAAADPAGERVSTDPCQWKSRDGRG